MTQDFRTIGADDLDQLQRLGPAPSFQLARPPLGIASAQRVLFRIDEVSTPFDPRRGDRPQAGGSPPPPRLRAAIAGLHPTGTNLVYGLGERDQSISVTLGSWAEGGPASSGALLRALRGEYAPVRATRLGAEPPSDQLTRWGLLVGVPSPDDWPSEATGSRVDHIVRAMAGQPWSLRVVATPLDVAAAARLRLGLLEEMRRVETTASAMGAVNRLTALYIGYLDRALADISSGVGTGLWRTAVYLGGTQDGYPALAGLVTGAFSGDRSAHSPVRVIENPLVADWAAIWALPDDRDEAAIAQPYRYQSLLTAEQLAAFVDLPTLEANGFALRRSARFDVTRQRPPAPGEPVLPLGQIMDGGVQAADYAIGLPGLNRHAFVTGVTGSGKTNTMFQLLRQLDAAGLPFLVMEPSKSEYRALAAEAQFRGRMRVFTVGDDRTAPLRLNPFEVVGWPAMPLGVHIDLLRSCFVASFGMWTPLPQILERALHEVYRDRGWDPITNTNSRLPEGADPAAAFPTLADLARKAAKLVDSLGYDDRVRNDLRAAILTRINGLRVGGKGAMLDCERSTPMADLLEWPTLLELQNIGDDDDKAFFMALLFMRLVEHRRAYGTPGKGLAHLLVIEEAHRLLAATGGGSGGGDMVEADPRGKAVETFSNLISEVRAYGQGLAVVDQVPTKLAADVIKNTNIKIVHRVVAEDDRSVLAGAMAMSAEQKAGLAVLSVGEAVLFEEGEDAPLLVAIPRAKDLTDQTAPSDAMLVAMMDEAGGATRAEVGSCGEPCPGGATGCRDAASAAEEPLIARTFGKIVLSTLADAGARARLWSDLEAVVRMKQPAALDPDRWPCLVRHLAADLADRWGARRGWSYPDTVAFKQSVLAIVGGEAKGSAPADAVAQARTRLTIDAPTCPACGISATRFADMGTCLPRVAVDDLADEGLFAATFATADLADGDGTGPADRLWLVCNSAAYELAEYPSDGLDAAARSALGTNARRTLLCFGQQMLARNYSRAPWVVNNRLERLAAAQGAPLTNAATAPIEDAG